MTDERADGWYVVADSANYMRLECVDAGNVWKRAYIKWDRCIDFEDYANAPFVEGEERDPKWADQNLHICSLPIMVDDLLHLHAAGAEKGWFEWRKAGHEMEEVMARHGWRRA